MGGRAPSPDLMRDTRRHDLQRRSVSGIYIIDPQPTENKLSSCMPSRLYALSGLRGHHPPRCPRPAVLHTSWPIELRPMPRFVLRQWQLQRGLHSTPCRAMSPVRRVTSAKALTQDCNSAILIPSSVKNVVSIPPAPSFPSIADCIATCGLYTPYQSRGTGSPRSRHILHRPRHSGFCYLGA